MPYVRKSFEEMLETDFPMGFLMGILTGIILAGVAVKVKKGHRYETE